MSIFKLPMYVFIGFFFVTLISLSMTFANEQLPPLKLLTYSIYGGLAANIPWLLGKFLKLLLEEPTEEKPSESVSSGNGVSNSGYGGSSGSDCSGGDGGGC